MNRVAPPLRADMTTAPVQHPLHHQQQQQQAQQTQTQQQTQTRNSRRQARAFAAGPVSAQPLADDVLAKARAIAMAQAQIQAQVGAQRQAAAARGRFRSSSGSNLPVAPSSSAAQLQDARARRDPRGRAESAETLHQFHMRGAQQQQHYQHYQQQHYQQQQQQHYQNHHPQQRITSNCRTSSAGAANYAKMKNAAAVAAGRKPAATCSGSAGQVAAAAARTTSRSAAASAHQQAAASTTAAASTARHSTQQRVEWRVAIDPKSKRPYYYHPVTRETTWKKPTELVEKEKREKAQFFSAMENNIRLKLRDGKWLRDSSESLNAAMSNQDEERQSSSSTSSTASSSRSSIEGGNPSAASMKMMLKSGVSNVMATRSLPTTPDYVGGGRRSPESTFDNQRDSEDEDASAKRPTLFRTLSSYETPVMSEMKRSSDGGKMAVPSPIQERVRLGKLAPRASDLEAYARTTSMDTHHPAPPAMSSSSSASSPMARARSRRRSNSTGTIYVRMGTMNAPDQDTTIQCVATVLRAHMMEALDSPIAVDPRFNVFINQRDLHLSAISDDDHFDDGEFRSSEDCAASIPTLSEIAAFIKHVFARAQMESECIIMSLIYVERLLKATSGSLQLQGKNWRRILFCSMVMASKVWDDLSMCNADFSKIWPELTLKQINELELVYLSAVEYKVRVSAVSYAKYYFHLRSMCASMGMLAAFDESAPLNLDGARKMQVLSEEYQERSKLLPAPRRRSVTITTTSSAESLQVAAGGKVSASSSKASPAASLEQLVQMQVRPAGGNALSSSSLSMHRLSTMVKH